jgi:hypothetical protein
MIKNGFAIRKGSNVNHFVALWCVVRCRAYNAWPSDRFKRNYREKKRNDSQNQLCVPIHRKASVRERRSAAQYITRKPE